MADYQLLGDTFGYHPGYPGNPPPTQNPGLGTSQPGSGQASFGMLPNSVPGQQPYHGLQTQPPRPGYPQTSDSLMTHKMHPSYPGYHAPTTPGSSPALRPQYSQNYLSHPSMDSYSLSMGQSHMPGQSLGTPYGQHQSMMGQYPGQRLHSPSSLHSAPRHPSMPSQYASSYASQNSSSYHSGSSSELWSSGQSMSHLQQSPFSNFSSPATASNSSVSSSALHSSRTSQFASSDYTTNPSNPYFTNQMPNDSTYPPGYTGASTQSQPSTTSRSSSSSRSQQYSGQMGSYSTPPSASITAQASQPAAVTSSSSVSRFSHYSTYPQSMTFDPATQSRLSPYPTPPSGSQTPNSPQYRSSSGYPSSGSTQPTQHPVHSPRRPTATSPAGSPMPPTSHTPGPPSVGSNSTQNSNQGSAFSLTTPNTSHHMSSSSSSVPSVPSSLQQLEQMVMPHLGGPSSTSTSTSKSLATSSANSSTFFTANANSSPISPQSQSQSKMFSHFSSSNTSAQSSQFPYHQYPTTTPQAGNSVPWQPPAGQLSASSSHTTHSIKAGSMMQQPLVHGAQHMSSPTTSTTTKSHQVSDSTLHQPYAYSSSKTPNEMSENAEYSQSFTPSTPSSSSMPTSHTISQSGYNSIPNSSLPASSGINSYDSLPNPKQSSVKNDTQLFDHNKSSRSVMDPLTGDLNQMTSQQSQMSSLNSNSFHPMMQQSYPSQSMPGYPNQSSRFDHPMSNQYGMSSELSNSSYNTTEQDSSMIYDPYNIDNALGIAPPHQTMSEYRESQANIQHSGNADYVQNDPYAANFDDFETTSKRKGKGRPKKDATAVKKERKPRQPRTTTRGAGRGRGRGAKSAVVDRMPLPGMLGDYADTAVPYTAPGMGPPVNESLDMYNNSVDLYPSTNPLMSTNKLTPTNQMSVPPQMMNNAQTNLNSSVLSQPPTGDLISPYSIPTQPLVHPLPNQQHNSQLPQPSLPRSPQNNFESIPDNNYNQNFSSDQQMPIEQSSSIQTPSIVCDKDVSNDTKSLTYEDRFLVEPPVSNDTPATDTAKPESNTVPLMPSTLVPNIEDVNITPDVEKPHLPLNYNSMDISCAPPMNASLVPMYQDSATFQSSSADKGVLEHQENNELNDKTSNTTSFNSSMLDQSADVSNMVPFSDDPNIQQMNFVASTPVSEKSKKPKKRKSKKNESLNVETGDIIANQEEVKPKPKKKRVKKVKNAIDESNMSINNSTIVSSIDFEEKTQLSASNCDTITGVFSESDTPKPAKAKSKSKRKKSPKVVEKTDTTLETDATLCDLNGELPVSELVEEKHKKPKVKNKSPKKKLPKLALKLKQNKKRRRGFGSPDNSDLEKTPPPSPSPDDESAIHKRRSARNTKRHRYNDDIDLDLSDDEFVQKSDSNVVNVQLTEDTMVVEKFLASRMAKREIEVENDKKDGDTTKDEPVFIEIEEFFVKYKNLSYLHCEWKTEDELEKGDRRISQKVKRYKQKKDINVFDFLDEEPFNPDYVEVDRVLDVNEVEEFYEDQEEIQAPLAACSESDQVPPVSTEEVQAPSVNPEEVQAPVQSSEEEEEVKVPVPSSSEEDQVTDVCSEKVVVPEESCLEESEKVLDEQSDYQKECNEKLQDLSDKEDNDDEKKSEIVNKSNVEEIEIKKEVKSEIEDDSVMDTKSEVEKNDENIDLNENVEPCDDVKDASQAEESVQVDEKPKTKKVRIVRHYLVKWRGLSYEESTWELEDDIEPSKIEQFWKFRNPPPKSEWKIKKRPKAGEWEKLVQSPIYKNGNYLREYQLEGVNWLSFCWHNGQNCILADEMGLGKTIQSITFIHEMVNYGIPYPYLVIAPLSTIGNWQREFETWTDLNVVTYHGSSASRNMLQEYELYYKNEKNERIPNVYKFQVMITTFEVILSDCLELSSIKWVACVIDEAHRLKNRNCKLLEGLRMLTIDHRVLLTGTPLQNNVEELFSLLHFLEPSQFTSNENFMLEFGDLKTEAQVDKLKAILKPMMLRRLKEDVEKSLAPKEETIIEVELTNVQKKYYRAILERNFQFLSKGGTYANMPNLMNTVMELRKCCIHPFLINGAEEQILQEFRQQHSDESSLNAIIQASGKLVLIDKLLPRLKEDGHRVLIFSQMVRCLDILEDYLCQRRYPFERIDGRVRGNLRQAAIDRFSKPDSDRFVFLLCTRAGGLGINLTAADTVIIFDSDWNPQNDLQAQARCHRIGQKKHVKVYRLICRNTYEREMFDRASLKLGLDKAVLQSINSQKNIPDNQLSKKEIEDLLRKGAYGALMDDDNAGDKFCEEDIESILQRRTTKIIIESEGKGSTFSKASFATSDNRTDIEIDDPNFWEKWAKKANFDLDELKNRNELIVQEPRRRTQTKRFGADDAVLDISELDTSTDEEEAISMRTRGGRARVTKKRKRGRNYDPENDEDYAQEIGFGWTRSEFFKVEKGLLTFGWSRWDECIILANFKRNLTKLDVEDISRVILLFALQNYKGDEKVKSFILDLITPPSEKSSGAESEKELMQNEFNFEEKSRRTKKTKTSKTVCEELENLDWAKNEKYNPDVHLIDETYRKHLLRHANKILLRVRLLAYIKNEIIGDLHEKVFSCLHVKDIPIVYCQPDGDPPTTWWNEEADKSLIIGVYKHGYDRYNLMRQDPALCYLTRCGPPDGAALLAEITSEDDLGKTLEEDDEPETPATPATPQIEGPKEESKDSEVKIEVKEEKTTEQAYLPFPTTSEINNRLRRLITCYQRNFKKQEARIAQKARHLQRLERLEKFEAAIRERDNKKREQAQKKWSRREESDFYRVVSSFGVEHDRKTDTYDWTRFRMYAKLERKLDDTLTEYYKAFYAMCKKVVGRRLTEDEENLPISVDPVTEERANRCLARIELLYKVRDEILFHPELDERLKLCQPQLDLPEWWVCGKHDKDLLLGAAKYGLNRLDYNLMNDPELSFIDIVRNFEAQNALEAKKALEIEIFNEVKCCLHEIVDHIAKVVESDPDFIANKEVACEENNENLTDGLTAKENSSDGAKDSKDRLSFSHNEENQVNLPDSMNDNKDSVKPMEIDSYNSTSIIQPKPSLKWPRDRVLQIRLENVCLAIEKNEWPTFRSINPLCMAHSTTPSVATADSSPRPSTPCSLSSASQELTPHPTPDHTPRRESQSPFTGDFFYSNANSAVPINNNLINNVEDSTHRRRRRRRRFEIENDRTKLHSLLNTQFDQQPPPHSNQASTTSKNLPSTSTANSINSSTLTSSLFKNSKAGSLFNIPSQFLTPLLTNLPFNIRSALRDELLNDEKANLLFGNTLQSTLAAAAVANASKSTGSKKVNLESKGNLQSGPPPAHQSSTSRNALSLGTLDLTSKFKTATSAIEKSTPPANKSNHPFPAHKPSNKNLLPEKADVLDLSSVPSKQPTKPATMSDLFNQTLKKSIAPKSYPSQQPAPIQPASKRKGRIGSRIDALALNLQAKKMMEEVKHVDNATTSLANKLSKPTLPTISKNAFNEKDLFAAFSSNYSDKRQSNFLDDLSKQQAATPFVQSSRSNSSKSSTSTVTTSASQSTSFKKSPLDSTKAYINLMESLKLLNSKSTDKTGASDKMNLLKQNLKTIVEEHPDLLAQNPTFMSLISNPLFASTLNLNPPSQSTSTTDNKNNNKNVRSGKRTRSQFDPIKVPDELPNKRSLPSSSKNSIIDSKNPSLKYFSTLLENKNVDVESKIKNMIKEKSKSFKTPLTSASVSSIRTRTTDKQSSNSSFNNTSSSNFTNMNASNLLNNLSVAAAAASGTSTNKQAAASLLANTYANAFNASNSGKSNFSNAAASFANFGFNNNMLSSFPSMKMFLDAAAAAAASVSKSSTTSSSSSNTTTTTVASTTTTSTTPSLSSFASLFGNLPGLNNMTNPLFNFSNFANLANLNQSMNKKDGTPSIDLNTLASNLASFSGSNFSNNSSSDEKSKSSKSSSSFSSLSNKGKGNLNSTAAAAAAASMLGSSGLGSSALPFLYSNPNFSMSSLYNPLSLGNFNLTSPFLSNANLMNGLANFSNVFTSTTNTATSSSHSSKSKLSNPSTNKSSSKHVSNKSSTAPSGLSLASSLMASSSGANTSATLDSDDESLKSLMGHDDDDDLNGEFDADPREKESPKNVSKKQKPVTRHSTRELKSKRSATTSK